MLYAVIQDPSTGRRQVVELARDDYAEAFLSIVRSSLVAVTAFRELAENLAYGQSDTKVPPSG